MCIRDSYKGGQYQFIIGTDVAHVKAEIEKLGPITDIKQEPSANKRKFDQLLDIFAGIFTPIVPALTGAGTVSYTHLLFQKHLLFLPFDKPIIDAIIAV